MKQKILYIPKRPRKKIKADDCTTNFPSQFSEEFIKNVAGKRLLNPEFVQGCEIPHWKIADNLDEN